MIVVVFSNCSHFVMYFSACHSDRLQVFELVISKHVKFGDDLTFK